jgi:hypothetical protein
VSRLDHAPGFFHIFYDVSPDESGAFRVLQRVVQHRVVQADGGAREASILQVAVVALDVGRAGLLWRPSCGAM